MLPLTLKFAFGSVSWQEGAHWVGLHLPDVTLHPNLQNALVTTQSVDVRIELVPSGEQRYDSLHEDGVDTGLHCVVQPLEQGVFEIAQF